MEEIARGCVVARARVAATKGIAPALALALDANCTSVIIADEMLIHILQPHR
jgi:hypothetical protein